MVKAKGDDQQIKSEYENLSGRVDPKGMCQESDKVKA